MGMIKTSLSRLWVSRNCAALVGVMVLSGTTPSFAADFELGLEAFRQGDIEEALDEWRPLAQDGDRDAQQALGMVYEYGHGLGRDDAQAVHWYLRAAAQGHPEALYRLGVFYDNGWGGARVDGLAVDFYERAAQLGHAFAQHDLAFMHFNGTGGPQDGVQAYKWLKLASRQRADLMAKHLFTVSQSLTPDQIDEAEREAQTWLDAQIK